MPFVIAALVIVGVIGAVDLLLSYGVVRRLREHSRQLAVLGASANSGIMATTGSTVDEFFVTDNASVPLSRATFTEPTLVGFFTPGCSPCEDMFPRFVSAARRWRELSRPVLAVVASGRSDHPDDTYVERLAPVARVVVGEAAGTVTAAFHVRGYPVVCLVDEGGLVVADTLDLDRLADPVRV